MSFKRKGFHEFVAKFSKILGYSVLVQFKLKETSIKTDLFNTFRWPIGKLLLGNQKLEIWKKNQSTDFRAICEFTSNMKIVLILCQQQSSWSKSKFLADNILSWRLNMKFLRRNAEYQLCWIKKEFKWKKLKCWNVSW